MDEIVYFQYDKITGKGSKNSQNESLDHYFFMITFIWTDRYLTKPDKNRLSKTWNSRKTIKNSSPSKKIIWDQTIGATRYRMR